MKQKIKIGKAEVCLNGKSIRTFVDTALWREASGDFRTKSDALRNFNRVTLYVQDHFKDPNFAKINCTNCKIETLGKKTGVVVQKDKPDRPFYKCIICKEAHFNL